MPASEGRASGLAALARAYAGRVWRSVELQSRIATMGLVDSLAEQERLEQLLDGAKPRYRPGTEGLHYLLKTPFRYKPFDRWGSRFSRPHGQGLFYAAEARRTALAETTFYRLLFLAGPDEPRLPATKSTYTLFAVDVAAPQAIDLTVPPLAADAGRWTDLTDMTHTQSLGEAVREAGLDAIRYRSVRDPDGGAALALLTPCFASGIRAQETWHLSLLPAEAALYRDGGSGGEVFGYAWFLRDPRLSPLAPLLGQAGT